MIDLDYVNLDSTNWAAMRILERLPRRHVSTLPRGEADAYLRELHEQIDAHLGIIGALRSGQRAWLDVQLSSGRWVGRWFDECASESAIDCAYWWGEPIIAAGIGLRESTAAAEARQARADAGDLLVLLGDEW